MLLGSFTSSLLGMLNWLTLPAKGLGDGIVILLLTKVAYRRQSLFGVIVQEREEPVMVGRHSIERQKCSWSRTPRAHTPHHARE